MGVGENNNTIAASLVDLASINGQVWLEIEPDGIRLSGENSVPSQAGFSFVEFLPVSLWVDNGNGAPLLLVNQIFTDRYGQYEFVDLDPNLTYYVQFAPQIGTTFTLQDQGNDDAVDSDVDPSTGIAGPINLTPGEIREHVDAELAEPQSTLGGRVFDDLNRDGLRSSGETGIEGIFVALLDQSGQTIRSTTTASDGLYQFANINSGSYRVQFVLPANSIFGYTLKNQGSDDTVDSDADPTTGQTDL